VSYVRLRKITEGILHVGRGLYIPGDLSVLFPSPTLLEPFSFLKSISVKPFFSEMSEPTAVDLPQDDLKKQVTPSIISSSASSEEAQKSLQFTEIEHAMGFWQAAKLHWPAIAWGLFINLATVLKGMSSSPYL
jgi:hypothetical protein